MTAQAVQQVAHARFVPASKLDFTRYAKNLAWLIKRPLQECQEILARIYGYEHLHELQANLDRGLQAGPYWDDGAEEMGGGDRDANPYEGRPVLPASFSGQRSSWAGDVFSEWKKSRNESPYFEGQEYLIVDLGLTDSPVSHRDCVRRVKLYLEKVASVDQHGWPTGFWSFMRRYEPMKLGPYSTNAMQEAFGVMDCRTFPVTLQDHMSCSHMDVGVDVLLELSKGLDTGAYDEGFDFISDENVWPMFWEELDIAARQHLGWEYECIRDVFGHMVEFDRDDPRIQFVRWPNVKTYAACNTKMPYAEAAEGVRTWRNSWLISAAEAWREDHKPIFTRNWDTFLEAERRWDWRQGTLQFAANFERCHETDSVAYHFFSASLTAPYKEQQNVTSGLAVGWLFSPCNDGSYCDGEDLKYALAEKDSIVEDGWALVKRYMSIRGIPDMDTWVNSGEGCAMLVGRVTMAKSHNTVEEIAKFCRMLGKATTDEDGFDHITSNDTYWREQLPGANGEQDPMQDLYMVNAPGIIVLEVPGLQETGFLIGNEDGEGSQIVVTTGVVKGNRSYARESRRHNYSRRENGKAANDDAPRVRAILEQIGDAGVDIILTGSFDNPFPARPEAEDTTAD